MNAAFDPSVKEFPFSQEYPDADSMDRVKRDVSYLACYASDASQIVHVGSGVGMSIARADTMTELVELVRHCHSADRGAFSEGGSGVVLVDSGDGWRHLDDAEHEAWLCALRGVQ